MVTIRIKGGLGNQLFQYAAGYALAKRMNQKLKLDSSFFPQQTLRGFKLGYLNVTFGDVVEHQSGLVKAYKNKYLNKTLRKANVRALPCGKQTKYLLETRSDIVPEFFNISAPNIYLDGYYQSEKYFREYKADLIQQFTPNYPSEAEYESALAEIQGREAVAVHVRRGDFLNAQNDPNPNHYLLGELQDVNQKYLDALKRALEQADGLDRVFAHHITNKSGKYIVFCSGKEHMDEMISHVPEWFAAIDTKPTVYKALSDDPATDKAFAAFKADNSKHLKLLFCIDMLNEGVHVAGISGVILFRPTISPIIYKQQIGRALTAGDSATPLILDVVNNFEGLSSISGLQNEMTAAVQRLYANGEGDKIVTDRFEVVEQVHNCRVLFEQLQSSLSSTWDHYFSEASIYYAENGNLDIPRRYKTPMGLSLGTWLQLQRQIRSGKCTGSLTEQQIERLDSIGMRWDSYNDLAWTRGLAAAEQYYAKHGDLLVPVGWVTDDGFLLGTWVCNRRAEKAAGKLDDDKIEELENIGMVWDAFSEKWERGFAAAAQYYAEHGNLVMPISYTTKDGLRLGVWVRNQKQTYANGTLQQEKAARLEGIGIRWEQNNYDFQWSEAYAAAKRYFEEYGSLNVPIAYTTADGIALGKWVARQQYAHNNPGKSNCKLTPERVELLDKIGMQWEKPDPWQHRYELAQDYLQEHGNLLIPAKYKTDDGIWLGRWLYEQKVLLRKKSPKLSVDKIDKLRKLLDEEPTEKAG